jgi:hypothetical protein
MAVIHESEISYSHLSLLDPLGRVFRWNGRIYRGIRSTGAELVRNLFASGCLDELAKRGFFPASRLTDHVLRGFDLVVEHEEIPVVTYPYEWTFDMLRDAALAALEMIEISARFGWELSDLHPYNVLFRGAVPVYVDLGSFRPIPSGKDRRKASDHHKFLKTFWRPLALWASGDAFMAKSILSGSEPYMPDQSWWLYQHSTLRAISPRLGARWSRRLDRWARNGARLLHRTRVLSRLPRSVASRLPVEILAREPALLREKIARLPQPLPAGWENYHAEVFQGGRPVSNPRFDWLLDTIRSLDCESVTELAGNQGAFTALIAEKTQIKNLICTDYSSGPINDFYRYCRTQAPAREGVHLQGAVLNFMAPELLARTQPPSDRLRSDLVVALGVLHHLLLTQNFHPREVLSTIASYTRRYAIIEFMPLGLWTEKKSKPVPAWYTTDWFHGYFSEIFDVIAFKQLHPNRIAYVGRLKTAEAAKQQESLAA